MKKFFISIFILLNASATKAQWQTHFSNYNATNNGDILTIIKENNIQIDAAQNTLVINDREPIRLSIFQKIDPSGNVLWKDTLLQGGLLQSANAKFTMAADTSYVLGTYGNNLNSSNAEAVATYKIDHNGTILKQHVVNAGGTNYFSQEIQMLANGSILTSFISNNANQNWQLTLECLDPANLNVQWVKNFPWPGYSNTKVMLCADANNNSYVSFTIDSVNNGNYTRKSSIYKLDALGGTIWNKTYYNRRFIFGSIQGNQLITAGETIAPNVIVTNNIGDVTISSINTSNGSFLWDKTYNAISNEKEVVNHLTIANNTIAICGYQDIQDLASNHQTSFINLYNITTGALLKNKTTQQFEYMHAAGFLPGSNHLVSRSSKGSQLFITEMDSSGNNPVITSYNFTYGVGWNAMAIGNTGDIAFAVSDVTCANRGVTIQKISKNALGVFSIQKNKMQVYPNPSAQYLFLQNVEKNTAFTITTLQGKIILQQQNVNNKIDVSNLPAATYFLTMKNNDHLETILWQKIN